MVAQIARINLTVSDELYRLAERHAKRAGMSIPAYVREAVARSAGWDEAMHVLAELQQRNAQEIAELKQDVAALRGET